MRRSMLLKVVLMAGTLVSGYGWSSEIEAIRALIGEFKVGIEHKETLTEAKDGTPPLQERRLDLHCGRREPHRALQPVPEPAAGVHRQLPVAPERRHGCRSGQRTFRELVPGQRDPRDPGRSGCVRGSPPPYGDTGGRGRTSASDLGTGQGAVFDAALYRARGRPRGLCPAGPGAGAATGGADRGPADLLSRRLRPGVRPAVASLRQDRQRRGGSAA